MTDVHDARTAFASFLRPQLAKLLSAIRLDVVYHRGRGDLLFYKNSEGQDIEVTDFLGGFGAGLFGHHPPRLVRVLKATLDEERPFHAQASIRGLAGQLGRALAQRVGQVTGRRYVVTLANSGTEVIEAAIKHAEMARVNRHAKAYAALKDQTEDIRRRIRRGAAWLKPGQTLPTASRTLEDALAAILEEQRKEDDVPPTFLALEGAFHGKTTGSLRLTHNLEYREPFRRAGVRAEFLSKANLAEALESQVARTRGRQFRWQLAADGEVSLQVTPRSHIAALLVEPIQGEGGIHVLSRDVLGLLRSVATREGFPLVMDEIQSGLGRTGSWMASEKSGVHGDYYTFSKALGGGLVKVAALVIDAEHAVPEFGRLHTSTFAEDDLSSAVALEVLNWLDENDGALLRQCQRQGERLMGGLRQVQARHPQILRSVRGEGLMVGIEWFVPLATAAPLMRVLAEQSLLGFVISGYLLNEHRMRVAPTLSSHGTLRIQPSAFIDDERVDALCLAIDAVAQALRDNDVLALCGYLADRLGASAPQAGLVPQERPRLSADGGVQRAAFLGHFLEPRALREFEPGLSKLSDDECARFLQRTQEVLEPFVVQTVHMTSARGITTELNVLGVPFTPAQVLDRLRAGDVEWPLGLVKQGVDLAKSLGATVVGFGGYTSIVSDNCVAIHESSIALTSGNALTAAAAVEALFLAAGRRGMPEGCLGVVGALGNLGEVMAEFAADRVSSLLLVGRPGTERKLAKAVEALYVKLWRSLQAGMTTTGVLARIAQSRTAEGLRHAEDANELGRRLREGLLEELGEAAPLRLSSDMSALKACSLIISATNAARPVIFPEHVGAHPVVLCDVATPRDVDASVGRQRPNAVVLKGGRILAPLGQQADVSALRLESGELYGCLAETLVLSMAGATEHFSYGPLTAPQLRRIHALALEHGFKIEERLYDDED